MSGSRTVQCASCVIRGHTLADQCRKLLWWPSLVVAQVQRPESPHRYPEFHQSFTHSILNTHATLQLKPKSQFLIRTVLLWLDRCTVHCTDRTVEEALKPWFLCQGSLSPLLTSTLNPDLQIQNKKKEDKQRFMFLRIPLVSIVACMHPAVVILVG